MSPFWYGFYSDQLLLLGVMCLVYDTGHCLCYFLVSSVNSVWHLSRSLSIRILRHTAWVCSRPKSLLKTHWSVSQYGLDGLPSFSTLTLFLQSACRQPYQEGVRQDSLLAGSSPSDILATACAPPSATLISRFFFSRDRRVVILFLTWLNCLHTILNTCQCCCLKYVILTFDHQLRHVSK